MIRELRYIADDLRHGREVEPVTVRTFLWWFGAQRRGPNIVRRIREELSEAGLVTVPDFESRWVDAPINFVSASTSPSEPPGTQDAVGEERPVEESGWVTRDASYRISKLRSANQEVVRTSPDKSIEEAITILMARDFSQLPVMTNDRDVKGVVSWKSIGSRLALGRSVTFVREAMEPHHEVSSDISIFDAIPIITRNDYVLVRGDQNKITVIVTASDLSMQFRALSEPFLLLGEIENLIRNMIGARFSSSDLLDAVDPSGPSRSIGGVDDLTFGEYIRLLQNPVRWAQLGLAIDRVLFCSDLNSVREVRNDVTHFDPDGITPEEIELLRDFKSFLEQLEMISGS